MGAAVASAIQGDVIWASQGRSEATASRAASAGARDVATVAGVVAEADVIVSVCPPAAAMALADSVFRAGYEGLFVDANAVAPATATAIGRRFERFVDGGIVGSPPAGHAETRIYLSGAEADVAASLFAGSLIQPVVLGGAPGTASALKMSYAAWTKGTSALLLATAAAAYTHGVLDPLLEEWATSIPGLPERLRTTSGRVGAKAWRFAGEMEEIADTFSAAGVPDGFHLAARDIYESLADLRNAENSATVEAVLSRIVGGGI